MFAVVADELTFQLSGSVFVHWNMGTIVAKKKFQLESCLCKLNLPVFFLSFALLINLFNFCFKALTFADSFRTLSALLPSSDVLFICPVHLLSIFFPGSS